MKNPLVLALVTLPLAGCITPQQEQIVENNCRALAAGQSGYYGPQGQNNSPDAAKAYANEYYACTDRTRFTVAYYGYPGYDYAYGYGYGYPYASGYPYAYPYPYYYPPYYGPTVGIGVGFGFRRR